MLQEKLDDLCVNIIEQLLIELKTNKCKALITYGDLTSKLRYNINPRNLDNPLGVISDYCKEHGMPLLSTIVVNKDTYMPGAGYFKYYFADKSKDEYEVIFKRELTKVREYKHWAQLAELLSIKII